MKRLFDDNNWRIQKSMMAVLLIFYPILTVIFLALRGISSIERNFLFSIALNLSGMVVCLFLFMSFVRGRKKRNLRTICFTYLLGFTALEMFLTSVSYLIPVYGSWAMLLMLVETILEISAVLMSIVFLTYLHELSEEEAPILRKIYKAILVISILAILLILGNVYGHYLFYIQDGMYIETSYYKLYTFYPVATNLLYLVFLLKMKISITSKRVLATFILLPTIGIVIYCLTQITLIYPAMLCSLVFIHGYLFTAQEAELIKSKLALVSRENELLRVKNEQVRVETELNVAARIQSQVLPKIFPPFPVYDNFDLYAFMQPAKEVGGDFYDFFLIDSDHIGLVVADVSDKGVPAALYMMVVRTMLRNIAMQGLSPADVLHQVNQQLCEGENDMDMFVTVWYGIYEISSGKLTAANGGHEYPILRSPDGTYRLYKDPHGFVLGGLEGVRYRNYELTLAPGSAIFIYSDGVPEARNGKQEFFGIERALKALNQEKDVESKQLIQHVYETIKEFTMDEQAFDDITMLVLQVK